ncbi:hypothetical protein BC833DRAFT_620589 [Globomyces pollinis-pini]|nr:hypothetical protein BC833DRAFT_620589 [Globomyces pollinis-pini]
MSLIISWNKKKQTVHFDELYAEFGDDWTAHITLDELLERIAKSSGVDKRRIKLLHSGERNHSSHSSWWRRLTSNGDSGSWVWMKTPSATLKSYGLRSNSKIIMMGDRNASQAPLPPNIPTNVVETLTPEEKAIKQLQSFIDEINVTLIPKMEKLKDSLDNLELKKMTIREMELCAIQVSELLLQQLLKVDGIQSESDLVRLKRKATVRYIQENMDLADSLKTKVLDLKSTL